LPPPDAPNNCGIREDWPVIENEVEFPKDYVEFVGKYGLGKIADFLAIFNRFTDNEYLNFFVQKKNILEDLNCLVEEDPDYFKYIPYPLDNGLLPIGATDNGDYIFWVISNNSGSESWKTAILASRSPNVEFFDENITSLLEGILSKRIKSISFPDDFPPNDISFEKI
jgi:hypothetical protein